MAFQKTEQPNDPAAATLWRDPDFLKLWSGQSLSLIGSQVTVFAIPLVAAILLHASSTEMGILGALARLPMVLFLFVGVWVDRMRRRPVLIWSDAGRAAILLTIPILHFADLLSLAWMYAAVLLLGVLSVLFEIAYRSYLPSLVPPEQLGDANSKLQLSESLAKAVGPGVAGALVAAVSAATVILIDVVSYVASTISCLLIRKPEERPATDGDRDHIFKEIGKGLRWVMGQPLIRPIALASAVYSFFELGMLQAIFVLFMLREPGLSGAWIGFVVAMGGIGAIIGAWLSVRLLRRFGLGPTLLGCTVVGNSALLLTPLAGDPLWLGVGILAFSQFVVQLFTQVFVANHVTLLQSITPPEMMGRLFATIWSLGLVPAPLGALLAGLLGESIGLRPTVAIAVVIGGLVPIALLAFSPIPRLKEMPAPAAAPRGEGE